MSGDRVDALDGVWGYGLYRVTHLSQAERNIMSVIEFSLEERDLMVQQIQRYFQDEHDQELGQFDAGFILDFFATKIGPFFYNRGLYDSQAILQKRIDSVLEAIYGMEKTTDYKRPE